MLIVPSFLETFLNFSSKRQVFSCFLFFFYFLFSNFWAHLLLHITLCHNLYLLIHQLLRPFWCIRRPNFLFEICLKTNWLFDSFFLKFFHFPIEACTFHSQHLHCLACCNVSSFPLRINFTKIIRNK